MNVRENKLPAEGSNLSEEALKVAKKIFSSLLLACKNLSLYPQGHTISKNSIHQFYEQLSDFLHKYGTLRFEIERERIITESGLISEGLPDEGALHFTLFQVGIRWLEFLKGIEHKEIEDILIILDKYSKLSGEADGDIVTAFWETQFPHLKYEVAEFSWGGDQEEVTDFSDLSDEQAAGMQLRAFKWVDTDPQDPAIDDADLVLTPQEKEMLKEMVRREEEEDLTSYLDALMDTLLQHRDEENFNVILGVLSEEFTSSLGRRDFRVTLKILQGLRQVLDISQGEIPWAVPSIEAFGVNASGPGSLAPLKEVWRLLDSEEAEILGQIFKILTPQAIHTLVSLLPQTQSAPLRQTLLDSIIFLASQDMRPLETMLHNADENLVEKLVPVIVSIPGDRSLRCLIGLARHASSRVRNDAVKGLLWRDPAHVSDIFDMIDNMEDSMRRMILEQLGRSRDESVENLLLAYLRNMKFSNIEENYFMLCFRTLGKCGSARSIPFLRESLFKRAFMPGSRRSALRRGAATALASLNFPEAEMVLKAAGRSFYPSLRSAVKKVRQEGQHRGGR